ncbi:hypothetical protein PVAND_014949 [Polypedilum vanderplanki]|uniref:Uncharacterized protein n=1 Tax=Polypedilum vanderplanki TaxID=319348 RepID=A0A9J6BBK4_POLVA|nr:hypothetical protein PVAND_014949 [Polypedilum vanderplanki]
MEASQNTQSLPPTEQHNREKLRKFLTVLDQISDDLDSGYINFLSMEVVSLGISSRTETDFMVQRIHDRAIAIPKQSRQCVEFGKNIYTELRDDLGSSFLMSMTMKALNSMFEAMNLLSVTGITKIKPENAHATALFYGNMFNLGIVTPSDLFKTVTIFQELGQSGEISQYILQTIKGRVIERMRTEDPLNPFIKRLYEMIVKDQMDTLDTRRKLQQVRGPEAVFITRKTDYPNSNHAIVTCSSLELLNRSYASQALMMASEAESAKNKLIPKALQKPLAVQSSKTTKSDQKIIAEFEAYLKSIKTNKQLSFNLEHFKTCKDNERKQCAFKIVSIAIDQPAKIESFAQIANKILQTHQRTKGNEKSFVNHLQDACDEKMKIFNTQHKNWMEVESFGLFLGHMYVLEVQKTYLMNQWCDKIRKLSDENDLALNMYFKVFKIVHEKMKRKDLRIYNLCLNDMKKYKNEERIPSIYKNWLDDLIGETQTKPTLKNSTVAKITLQEPKNLVTTGAIKKTPSPPLITETTQVCTALREYLNCIQNKQQAVIPKNHLKTASEAAIQGIALLFLEHSILYPEKSGIYCNILKNLILTSFENDNQRRNFMTHFNGYIYVEMKKILKEEKPQSSNWSRVNLLSIFLCELFNQHIIEVVVIQSWLDKLQMMALKDCNEAAKEYNQCVIKVGDKIGDDNLTMIGVEAEEEESSEEENLNDENSKEIVKYEEKKKEIKENFEIIQNEEIEENKVEVKKLTREQYGYFKYTDIKKLTTVELYKLIDSYNIDNAEKSAEFANFYFSLMKTATEDHKTYATIATMIEARLSKNVGFMGFIITMVTIFFSEAAKSYQLKSQEDIDNLMMITKYLARFYCLDYIQPEFMVYALKQLSHNNFEFPFQAYALYEVLKIAGTKMAINGISLTECYFRLQGRAYHAKEIFDYAKLNEVIDFMKEICRFGKQTGKRDENLSEIREILKNLKHDNFAKAANTIKEMEFFSFDKATEIFIEISIANYENAENFAKFLVEIGEFTCEGLDRFEKNLRVQIMSSYIAKFQALIKRSLEISSMKNRKAKRAEELSIKNKLLAILCLISNFYKYKLLKPKKLATFIRNLQDLKVSKNHLDIDVVKMLIRTTKSKIDEKLFCKFLTEIGFDQSKEIGDDFEDFSKLVILTDDLKLKIFTDEKIMKKFIEKIFIHCGNERNLIPKSIEFCKDLCMNFKFSEFLNEFVNSFGFLTAIEEENEEKLKNSLTLTICLYKNELISYDSLRPWLSSTIIFKFTYNEILDIIDIIKCNKNDEIEVKIHHLQSVIHEKLIEMCNGIKNDLKILEGT